jgi:hypothetical protein
MTLVVVVVATALVSIGRVSLFSLRTSGSGVGVPQTSPVTARCDGLARGRRMTGLLRWHALLEKSAYALRVGWACGVVIGTRVFEAQVAAGWVAGWVFVVVGGLGWRCSGAEIEI